MAVGCSPSYEDIENETPTIRIINNAEELSKRISVVNKPVKLIYPDTSAKVRSAQEQNEPWVLLADVETPTVSGQKLSATQVQIVGTNVYVSYHKRGSDHLGAVEVFDVSDLLNPQIISRIEFLDADVISITVDEAGGVEKLWVSLSDRTHGAVLRQIDLLGNGAFSNAVEDVVISESLSGSTETPASANSVIHSDRFLYVTAGKRNGGTFRFDASTLELIDAQEYENAKYVATNGVDIVSLAAGNNSELRVFPASGNAKTLNIGSITHQGVGADSLMGKTMIHFAEAFPNIAFVAMGQFGVKGYDITADNNSILTEQFVSPPGMLSFGNSNGLASDGEFLYLANGADGLSVAHIPENSSGELDILYTFDLADETGASVNHVSATVAGNFVFVAKGLEGGLKILQKTVLPPLPPVF
ncbi:MAG: hypothetical protein AAFW89_14325 [Bacteroidota bacterium]